MRHTRSPENNFIRGQPETGVEYAEDLQRFVDLLGGRNIAACCVEPLGGTAGGILVPPKGYLERLREICDQNCILLIFDEVLSGFGRTGKAFAAQSFGVTPDLIVMGKAMTNGVLQMSAVAVSETIYETVTGAAPEGQIELFQGYTPTREVPYPAPQPSRPWTSTRRNGSSTVRRRCRRISSNPFSRSGICP